MENFTLEQCRSYLKRIQDACICQVCHEPLRSPDIVLCTNGHAVCTSCKGRVSNCAVCRSHYCNAKPTILCQMVEILPRFCRFNYSCNRFLSDGDDHESWCEFRLLPCLYCKTGVESQSLLDHLANVHTYRPHRMVETDFQKPDFQCNTGLQINIAVLKLYDDHMFNIHYLYSLSDRGILVHITFWPTRSFDKNTFMFNLELCSIDNKVSLTFSQEVSILVNVKTVVFIIAESTLKAFNGKHVLFRTTISSPEISELQAETSIDSSPKDPSLEIPTKKVKVENDQS